MNLNLWKPLKITNPLLQNIFNQPLDGKVLPNGKIQSHPLVIFENIEDKTYYCIRLQTANPSTIKNNIKIDNGSYQKLNYWNKVNEVAITKDIFIIDKQLLENNVDQYIYENTFELDDNDKNLIIQDLNKRINSIPPDFNIIKISNNLKNNLVLYTNNNLIKNQIDSTISFNNQRVKKSTKNYYAYHFDKEKFLNDVNTSNREYTEEALRNIKLCINKELNIDNNDFKYELDTKTNNYVYKEIIESNNKNILSEFDKTPTSFEDSEVIKEYKEYLQENKDKDKLNKSEKRRIN